MGEFLQQFVVQTGVQVQTDSRAFNSATEFNDLYPQPFFYGHHSANVCQFSSFVVRRRRVMNWLPYPAGISRGASEVVLMYLLNERNQLG